MVPSFTGHHRSVFPASSRPFLITVDEGRSGTKYTVREVSVSCDDGKKQRRDVYALRLKGLILKHKVAKITNPRIFLRTSLS